MVNFGGIISAHLILVDLCNFPSVKVEKVQFLFVCLFTSSLLNYDDDYVAGTFVSVFLPSLGVSL